MGNHAAELYREVEAATVTFADWYASTIVPQLEETLKNMPVPAREALRTASRHTMKACWNAALDATLDVLPCADVSKVHIDGLRA
jgi:hypothetical protein